MTETMTIEEKISEAASEINASAIRGGDYIYYAAEVSEWYRVTEGELIDLYDLMHAADDSDDEDDQAIASDAYSHWCNASGEEFAPSFEEVSDLSEGVYSAAQLNPPSGDDCTHLLVRHDGSLGWSDSKGEQSEDSTFSVSELCDEAAAKKPIEKVL